MVVYNDHLYLGGPKMVIYSKNVVTPNGVIEAFITIKEGKIKSIQKEFTGDFIDYSDQIIMPGYVDVHIHGCRSVV